MTKTPKRRNHVVQAMMLRSQKAGKHRNKKRHINKYKCRKKVKEQS